MRTRILAVAAAFAVGFVACGGDDGPQSPVIPSFHGAPKSLRILGDFAFTSVGQTRQLTASATFGNGAVSNVTSQAEWSSTNPAVVTVTGGLAKVVGFGETQITATYRNVSSEAVVVSAKQVVTLSSLSIAGPADVAPGTTTQYTATGNYSDGTTRDLTTDVSWSSFPNALLRHVGGGRFQAFLAGDARVSVNSPRSASMAVIVVPPGTFKLSGTIRDASGPVENVLIQVTSGTGTGLNRISTFNGTYALFGVAGVVGLRASAPGYSTRELQVTVDSHSVRDVDISPVSQPDDVSGNWTFVVTTSSACSDTWPAQARRREVAATVAQQGTRLTIRFPNAPFGNNNAARIAGSTFSMTLFYDDYYLIYGLLERLSPTEWLGINGDLTGTATSTSITGELVGNFNYYQSLATSSFPTGTPRACAADRQFEFRR